MTEMMHGPLRQKAPDPVIPLWWQTIDKISLILVSILFAIGIVLLFASSPTLADNNNLPRFHYVERQLIFATLGVIVMIYISFMSVHSILKGSIVAVIILLLAVMLLPIFGTDYGKGAVRWYSLGFSAFQPSEFIKPFFVVLAAWLMSLSYERGAPPVMAISLSIMGLLSGLLVLQPDYGQTFLIVFAWLVMCFASGRGDAHLVGMLCFICLGAAFAYQYDPHFAGRINGFLNPEIDPKEQIGYAMNAIREGGLFGVGVGDGAVKLHLPDAHTDFIISVAAEEFGVMLLFVILGLYGLISSRAFKRVSVQKKPFNRLAAIGLASIFCMQAMVNISVALRIVPTKGMTLPLISYGGSSLIATFITLGLLLAFTRAKGQNTPQGYGA